MAPTLAELGHRRALITGASSGIGLEIAHALVAEGVAVTGMSRSAPPEAPAGYRHLAVDLSDPAAIEAALVEVRREPPDIWINNAGFGLLGGAWKPEMEAIETVLAVMLRVPIHLSRFFAELCRERPEQPAYLIQVSSLAVELPIPGMPYYNAAKAGLSSFTSSLLLDADAPFKVIDFRPGDVDTPFITRDELQHAAANPKLHKTLLCHHRQAPHPRQAAMALIAAMRRGRQGIVRCGNFFQSTIAPLGPRLLPQKSLLATIRRYYKQ